MQKLLLLLVFCCGFTSIQAQNFSAKRIKKHVAFLASDKLKGRGTGSPEELKAAQYIAKQFKKIGLQPKGDKGTWLHQFDFRRSSDPHGMSKDGPIEYSYNVVGYLDNGAPNTIVIGAHYDHLGLGHDHNSLDPNPDGKIHNGADDNASGTAGVIEMARFFTDNGIKEQHNFLFICFSGEELGLVGSKKYCERPTIDLNSVSFMLNMDMIGRLNPEKRLVIGGVGTSPNFVPTLNNLKHDLSIKQDSAGQGPSDHTSFYLKNLPVLFAFTGQHTDYHKPTDDTEKVNFDGECQVLDLLVTVIKALDGTPKLVFQETKLKDQGTNSGFKVTLGIIPDYTFDGKGLRVDGVTEGKPAAKAGVQKGDIIVQLGQDKVDDMASYMKSLNNHAKGQKSTVKVKRGEKEMEMEVQF
jgi:Peptidase family M28/PDZ domain